MFTYVGYPASISHREVNIADTFSNKPSYLMRKEKNFEYDSNENIKEDIFCST